MEYGNYSITAQTIIILIYIYFILATIVHYTLIVLKVCALSTLIETLVLKQVHHFLFIHRRVRKNVRSV